MPGSTGVEALDDRHTMASFLLWLRENGHVSSPTYETALAVLLSPVSWADEFAAYRAEVETSDDRRAV